MHVSSPLSRKITVENQNYLYFGGTAYLGIPQHKAFQNLYVEGVERFGVNNGTSRNNNVQLGIYDEAERFAADYFGANACLITSSGYLAAQLTIKRLSAVGEVRYAPATHPALWLNETPKTKGSFNEWAKALVAEINQSNIKDWVVISNSLNNLYPEVYDFSFVREIDEKKNITLIVDDSHGIGVLNTFSTSPTLKNVETVVVASLAKALGVDAGLVLGSEKIISLLKQTNEFLGASPPAAAGLFAFMHASSIYQEEHTKLMQLTNWLSAVLKNNASWEFAPNFPVFLTTAAGAEEKLMSKQILMSSFAYPDKNGSLINRIVLSSWHTLADIEELTLALAK